MRTSQVCLQLSRELGIDISERTVNGMVRGWPVATLPRIVNNKRQWSDADVARLRAEFQQRLTRAAS